LPVFSHTHTHTHTWRVTCSLRYLRSNPSNLDSMISSASRFDGVTSAALAVDTFLFLGGFLVCLNTLHMLDRRHTFPWIKFYVHRYLRLTPSYAFTMLMFLQVCPCTLCCGARGFALMAGLTECAWLTPARRWPAFSARGLFGFGRRRTTHDWAATPPPRRRAAATSTGGPICSTFKICILDTPTRRAV
jgi:hypothetical protein